MPDLCVDVCVVHVALRVHPSCHKCAGWVVVCCMYMQQPRDVVHCYLTHLTGAYRMSRPDDICRFGPCALAHTCCIIPLKPSARYEESPLLVHVSAEQKISAHGGATPCPEQFGHCRWPLPMQMGHTTAHSNISCSEPSMSGYSTGICHVITLLPAPQAACQSVWPTGVVKAGNRQQIQHCQAPVADPACVTLYGVGNSCACTEQAHRSHVTLVLITTDALHKQAYHRRYRSERPLRPCTCCRLPICCAACGCCFSHLYSDGSNSCITEPSLLCYCWHWLLQCSRMVNMLMIAHAFATINVVRARCKTFPDLVHFSTNALRSMAYLAPRKLSLSSLQCEGCNQRTPIQGCTTKRYWLEAPKGRRAH